MTMSRINDGKGYGFLGYVIQNAKLDAVMLRNDWSVAVLADMAEVNASTMHKYLKTGVHNKAYRNLCKKFPRWMEE